MSEWTETTLGKLCKFQAGDAFPKDQQGVTMGEYPFIKVSDMNLPGNERLIQRSNNWIRKADASKYRLHPPGSVVFAKIGEALRANRRRVLVRETIIDNNMMSASPLSGINPAFLLYVLEGIDFNDISRGSALPYLAASDLNKLAVKIPGPETQQAIAGTLSLLDRKIELNRRMNETLEKMAQTIFRDWFVDFGPTRRKENGEADPLAIMGGLTKDPARAAELSALFPDAVGNDGVPTGWRERPLDSIADFLNGLALQKHPAKPNEPDLPVIKIAELRNGLSERTNRAARTLPAKYIIRDGDFIFSWSGSLMAKVWTEGEGALNQHLFKVSSDLYPQWFYGLWVHHHMPEFQLIAASKATTMGHIQRMHLTAASTVCPPDATIAAMSSIMQPLWDMTIHNALENRSLAETRDYLLPRLMSGAVKVGAPVDEGGS